MPTDDELGETNCARRVLELDVAVPRLMTMTSVPVVVGPEADTGTVAAGVSAAGAFEFPPEHPARSASITAAGKRSFFTAGVLQSSGSTCAHFRLSWPYRLAMVVQC